MNVITRLGRYFVYLTVDVGRGCHGVDGFWLPLTAKHGEGQDGLSDAARVKPYAGNWNAEKHGIHALHAPIFCNIWDMDSIRRYSRVFHLNLYYTMLESKRSRMIHQGHPRTTLNSDITTISSVIILSLFTAYNDRTLFPTNILVE